jgi:hypothetical protein
MAETQKLIGVSLEGFGWMTGAVQTKPRLWRACKLKGWGASLAFLGLVFVVRFFLWHRSKIREVP